MLDGEVSDHVEARALSLNPQHIDIYSASWGPDDNGQVVDGPATLARAAFIQGVVKVRRKEKKEFLIRLKKELFVSCKPTLTCFYTLPRAAFIQGDVKVRRTERFFSHLA